MLELIQNINVAPTSKPLSVHATHVTNEILKIVLVNCFSITFANIVCKISRTRPIVGSTLGKNCWWLDGKGEAHLVYQGAATGCRYTR